jgi:hypothetical protein
MKITKSLRFLKEPRPAFFESNFYFKELNQWFFNPEIYIFFKWQFFENTNNYTTLVGQCNRWVGSLGRSQLKVGSEK